MSTPNRPKLPTTEVEYTPFKKKNRQKRFSKTRRDIGVPRREKVPKHDSSQSPVFEGKMKEEKTVDVKGLRDLKSDDVHTSPIGVVKIEKVEVKSELVANVKSVKQEVIQDSVALSDSTEKNEDLDIVVTAQITGTVTSPTIKDFLVQAGHSNVTDIEVELDLNLTCVGKYRH